MKNVILLIAIIGLSFFCINASSQNLYYVILEIDNITVDWDGDYCHFVVNRYYGTNETYMGGWGKTTAGNYSLAYTDVVGVNNLPTKVTITGEYEDNQLDEYWDIDTQFELSNHTMTYSQGGNNEFPDADYSLTIIPYLQIDCPSAVVCTSDAGAKITLNVSAIDPSWSLSSSSDKTLLSGEVQYKIGSNGSWTYLKDYDGNTSVDIVPSNFGTADIYGKQLFFRLYNDNFATYGHSNYGYTNSVYAFFFEPPTIDFTVNPPNCYENDDASVDVTLPSIPANSSINSYLVTVTKYVEGSGSLPGSITHSNGITYYADDITTNDISVNGNTFTIDNSFFGSDPMQITRGLYKIEVKYNETNLNLCKAETLALIEGPPQLTYNIDEVTEGYCTNSNSNCYSVKDITGNGKNIVISNISGGNFTGESIQYQYSLDNTTYNYINGTGEHTITAPLASTYTIYIQGVKASVTCIGSFVDAGAGYESSNSVSVSRPNTVVINPDTPVQPKCNSANTGGLSTGSIEFEITGGIPNYQFLLQKRVKGTSNSYTNTTNTTNYNSATGKYKYSGLMGNYDYRIIVGDRYTSNLTNHDFTINSMPDELTVTAPNINVKCNGDVGTITALAGGGPSSGTYSYKIDGGNYGAANTFTKSANTYTIYAKKDVCVASCTVIVNEPENPLAISVVSNSITSDVCDLDNGSVKFNITGGWSNKYPYFINVKKNGTIVDSKTINSGSLNNILFNGLVAGSYTVDVYSNYSSSSSYDCSASNSFDITASNPLSASSTLSTAPACSNANDGVVTLTISNGIAPFVIKDQSGNTIESAHNSSAYEHPGLSGGDNIGYLVTDNRGCSASTSILTISPRTDQISITGFTKINDASCSTANDGTVRIDVADGVPLYENAADKYWITITNSSNDNIYENYKIATGSTLNVPPGTYTLQAEDSEGCIDTYNQTLIVAGNGSPINSLNIGSTTNVSCSSNSDGKIVFSKSLDYNVSNYSFELYKNGSIVNNAILNDTKDTYSGLNVGNYNIRITHTASNCIAEASQSISNNNFAPNPNKTFSPLSCSSASDGQASISFDALYADGISGVDYNIKLFNANGTLAKENTSVTSFTATGLSNQAYNIEIEDNHYGCVYTGSLNIPILSSQNQVKLNETGKTVIHASCINAANGSVQIDALGGKSGTTYTFSADVFLGAQEISSYNSTSVDSDTYKYYNLPYNSEVHISVTDLAGCSYTGSPITINEIPSVDQFAIESISPVNASCEEKSNGRLNVNTKNGSGINYEIYETGTGTPILVKNGAISPVDVIKGLSSNSYKIELTDNNNCPAERTFLISHPDDLQFAVMDDHIEIQEKGGVGGISFSVSDGNKQFNWELKKGGILNSSGSIGEQSLDINNLTAGDYTLSIQDTAACNYTVDYVNGWLSKDIGIEEPEFPLQLHYSVDSVICNGENNGKIKWWATGGWGDYKYYWSDFQHLDLDSTRGGLAAGTYKVLVRDKLGAEREEQVIVYEPNELSFNTIGSDDIIDASCPGYLNSTVSVSVNNGILHPDGKLHFWAEESSGGSGKISEQLGDNNHIFSGLGAGNYAIYVEDRNGCIASSNTITINEPAMATVDFSNNYIKDKYQTTGWANIKVSGGNSKFNYKWENLSSGQVLYQDKSANKDLTFSNLLAGEYQITIEDTAQCAYWNGSSEKIIPISIIQPDSLLTLNIVDTSHVSCNKFNDGSCLVEASGGWGANYLYSSDNVNWKSNGLFDMLTAGNYQFYIKDTSGVVKTTVITITEPDTLTLSAGELINPSCPGYNDGKIQLTAQNGILFDNGMLQFWAEEVGGNGSKESLQYGSNNHNFSGLNDGEYILFTEDKNGCIAYTNEALFVEPDTAEVQFSYNYIKDKYQHTGWANVKITGGNSKFFYQWEDISNGILLDKDTTELKELDFNNLPAGKYQITLQDTANCAYWDGSALKIIPIEIVEPDSLLTLSIIDTTHVSCNKFSDGAYIVEASGGWGTAYQYSADSINWQNSGVFDLLPAGTYQIYIKDTVDIARHTEIVLTQPDTLNLFVDSFVNPSCPNYNDGKVQLSVLNGIPYNNGLQFWAVNQAGNDSIGIQYGGNNYLFTGASHGAYEIFVRDSNNCVAMKPAVFTEPDTALINLDFNYIRAKGDNTGFINAEILNGNGKFDYVWLNPVKDTIGSGKTTGSLHLSNLIAGDYTLHVKDTANCVYEDSVWMVRTIPMLEPADTLGFNEGVNTAVSCNGLSDGWIRIDAIGGWGNSYLYAINREPEAGDVNNVFTGLAEGSYTVYVKDTVGIVYSRTVNITQPDVLVADTAQIVHVNCYGENSGSILLQASGGNLSYLSSTDSLNWTEGVLLTGMVKGKYPVYIKDTLNCTVQLDSVTITEPSDIVKVSDEIRISRCRQNSGRIEATIQGGMPGYTYLWQNDSINSADYTSNVVDSIYSGMYNLTVTDRHGCFKLYSFGVSDLTDLTIDTVEVTDASCHGYSDGNALVSISNGNPEYSIKWYSGIELPGNTILENIQADNYLVGVSDTEGCLVFKGFTVGEPDTLDYIIGSITQPLCHGGFKGSLDIIPIGGTPDYSLIWGGGETGSSLNELLPGTYSVSVTDAHQCFATFDFDFDFQRTIKPNLGNDTLICAYAPLSIAPGLFASYDWLKSGMAFSNQMSPPIDMPGFYTLTVTDNDNCIGYDSIDIDVSFLAIDSIMTEDVTCNKYFDGSALVNYTAGWGTTSIQWPDNSSDEIWDNLSGGNYSVTISDSHGCSVLQNFSIYEPDTLIALENIVRQPLCYGVPDGVISLSPEGGRFPYKFDWNTGNTSNILSDLDTAIYRVTLTDSLNCIYQKEFDFIYQRTIKPNLGNDTLICEYAPLIINPGNFTSYQWSNSSGVFATEMSPAISTPDFYVLKVTDIDQCIGFDSINIEVSFLAINNLILNDVSCNKFADGHAKIEYTPGWGQTYISWPDNSVEETWSNLSGGNYNVVLTDNHGCSVQEYFSIYEPDTLGVTINNLTEPLCYGVQNGIIDISPTGGRAPYNFTWESGEVGNVVSNLDTGTYHFTLLDSMNCRYDGHYLFDYRRTIKPNLGNDTVVCHYTPYSINPGSFTSYSWIGPNGFSSDLVSPQLLVPGTYTVMVTDNDNCIGLDTMNLQVSFISIDNVDITDVSCNSLADGAATITYTPGYLSTDINWSDGQTSSQATLLSGGDYSVTIIDEHSCSRTETFSIYEPEPVELASTTITEPYCWGVPDGRIKVEATGGRGGYKYVWSNGKKGDLIRGLDIGTYSVYFEDKNNCSNSRSFELNYQYHLPVDLGADQTLCSGNDIMLYPGEYAGYEWYKINEGLLNSDTALIVNNEGEFWVEVTDWENCIARDTVYIQLQESSLEPAFLVASTVAMGDTLLLVEVSASTPDNFEWVIEGAHTITEEGPYYKKIVFNEMGVFSISMNAWLENCIGQERKTIIVTEAVDRSNSDENPYGSMTVVNFNAFPNPVSGSFEANIELDEAKDLVFYLIDINTGQTLEKRELEDVKESSERFNVPSVATTLMLFVIVEGERHALKIMVLP